MPLDFNAPVPAFHKSFLIPTGKKKIGCVCKQFCTAPMTSSSDENLVPLKSFFHSAKRSVVSVLDADGLPDTSSSHTEVLPFLK
jgi:hypothetical protein